MKKRDESKEFGSDRYRSWRADSFLWLHSLNVPDPYKILPIAAGVFQFVQTKMMKPQGQGKSSDPQQAMMNTMMNFMPLMVVVFGWTFASGPVIYWVTQSVFSVVQQWFITGWGSMKDWIPGLPELPEHRRLGYRAPRDLDEVVVMSGAAAKPAGVMGWFNQKMQEAQANANGANTRTSPAVPAASEAAGEMTPARVLERRSRRSHAGRNQRAAIRAAGKPRRPLTLRLEKRVVQRRSESASGGIAGGGLRLALPPCSYGQLDASFFQYLLFPLG